MIPYYHGGCQRTSFSFEGGYLNKSHYQRADAVLTSQTEEGGEVGWRGAGGEGGIKGTHAEEANDKEETGRRGERPRCKMMSDREEKQRRREEKGRYDNRFTTEPKPISILNLIQTS